MEIEEKIYKFGLAALDELLLHRNTSKNANVSIEDAAILSDMIIHVGPHGILTLDEDEITNFYQEWASRKSWITRQNEVSKQ